MKTAAAVALSLIGVACASPSFALDDKYHVTAAEKAACSQDAMRFCFDTYPDEDKLLACMKHNHSSLSEVCRVTFDAGVKRRHL